MATDDLIRRKRGLSAEELHILHIELDRRRKSTVVAYLLWFFLSWAALHKFYLGKVGEALLYLVGPWVALLLLGGGMLVADTTVQGGAILMMAGIIPLLAYAAWWFVDLFTIPRQVTRANEHLETQIIDEMESSRPRGDSLPGARPIHPV